MLYIRNNKSDDIYDYKSRQTFIKNELVTEREFRVYFPSLNPSAFEKVNIKKFNTYKFFGVRFECTTETEDINNA